MGETVQIKAADGHVFDVYRAAPKGKPRGAIVTIMEIFGVNGHIRSVADGFTAEGYVALAPAIYDRVQRGADLGYEGADFEKGRELRGKVQWDWVVADVTATVKVASEAGNVGIVGYCYGGGIVQAAACRVPGLSAAVGYYGGPWAELVNEAPQCPVLMHFAAADKHIPLTLAAEYKKKHPQTVVHVHDADHGFSCDQRPAVYDAYAHYRARAQTMGFFAATLD